jgi:predicted protein tyrosine phosphatase
MIEVFANIWVGSSADYECTVCHLPGWATVHACKEPYHRQAVGYRGRAVANNHPEYLIARRDHRIILNMIDTDNPSFFSKDMINAALEFIEKHHATNWKVLIHCNQGESRAPSLALLYLSAWLGVIPNKTLEEAEQRFRELYPNYHPKAGIRGHLQSNWQHYRREV